MCCAQTKPTDDMRDTYESVHPQGVSVRVYHTRSFYRAPPSEIHKQVRKIVPANGLKINLVVFQTLRSNHPSADLFHSGPETIWHAYIRNYSQRHLPNLPRVWETQPWLYIHKQRKGKSKSHAFVVLGAWNLHLDSVQLLKGSQTSALSVPELQRKFPTSVQRQCCEWKLCSGGISRDIRSICD